MPRVVVRPPPELLLVSRCYLSSFFPSFIFFLVSLSYLYARLPLLSLCSFPFFRLYLVSVFYLSSYLTFLSLLSSPSLLSLLFFSLHYLSSRLPFSPPSRISCLVSLSLIFFSFHFLSLFSSSLSRLSSRPPPPFLSPPRPSSSLISPNISEAVGVPILYRTFTIPALRSGKKYGLHCGEALTYPALILSFLTCPRLLQAGIRPNASLGRTEKWPSVWNIHLASWVFI